MKILLEAFLIYFKNYQTRALAINEPIKTIIMMKRMQPQPTPIPIKISLALTSGVKICLSIFFSSKKRLNLSTGGGSHGE